MWRPYAIECLANIGISLSGLFIPLLARELGLSFFELGLVGASYGLASLLSYSFFGRMSDRRLERKIFVCWGLGLASIAFLLQLLMWNFPSMVVVRSLAGFTVGIFSFPLLALVSRLPHYREKVGWFSGFGSLGWFFGYLLAGLVSVPFLGFSVAAVLFLFSFILSLGLLEVKERRVEVRPLGKIIRENLPLYASYFLRHTGAHAIWLIFPLFLMEELGASIFLVGMVHALNTGSQFVFMGTIGVKAGAGEGKRLLQVGLGLSSIVFITYYFASSYVQLLPVQLLLGLTWSSMFVGSLLHLLERNIERATSTGFLGSTLSLAGIVGPLFGGAISQIFGMRAVHLFACFLTLLGLAVSSRVR